MKFLVQWLDDILTALGIAVLFAGIWLQFGLGYALIAVGVTFLGLGLLVALK